MSTRVDLQIFNLQRCGRLRHRTTNTSPIERVRTYWVAYRSRRFWWCSLFWDRHRRTLLMVLHLQSFLERFDDSSWMPNSKFTTLSPHGHNSRETWKLNAKRGQTWFRDSHGRRAPRPALRPETPIPIPDQAGQPDIRLPDLNTRPHDQCPIPGLYTRPFLHDTRPFQPYLISVVRLPFAKERERLVLGDIRNVGSPFCRYPVCNTTNTILNLIEL